MKRLIVAAVLGMGMAMTAAHAQPNGFDRHVLGFESSLNTVLAEERVPGAAYAVVAGGQVVRIGAYGRTVLNGDRPVDPETVFRLASVSKGFAGTLAALIAHEGAFTLEEPITRYRPDFKIQGPVQSITIRHVLGQMTGLIPNAYDNLIEAGQTLDQIIPHFAALAPICQPGNCYTYQNNTFSLIEPVLENVTHTPYAELLARRFFEPLQMRHASIGYESFIGSENRAEPHVRDRAQGWRPDKVSPNYYRVAPAAGVNASAADMAEWLLALLGHRPEVLPKEVVELATTPNIRTRRDMNRNAWREHLTDAHYGLGWRVYSFRDEPLIYHGGWVAGYRADISLSRNRDIGLVILTNAEDNIVSELTVEFWAPLLERDPPAADSL